MAVNRNKIRTDPDTRDWFRSVGKQKDQYQGIWIVSPADKVLGGGDYRYDDLRGVLESLDAASERLRNFVEKAAKATLVGDVFDDAATGQGLLNYFLRALNCGALTEAEGLRLSGLTPEELRSGSFVKILKNRQSL